MGVDLFSSRRDTPEKAKWWKSENTKKANEIVMSKIPDGLFYFLQLNSQEDKKYITNGVFQHDLTSFMILTHDIVTKLMPNDIVKLRNQLFIVTEIQRKPRDKNFQYGTKPSYDTYISLRSA